MENRRCANATATYKYLGDIISNDGKNAKNIEARKNKINASTVSIKTIAANETLNTVETSVLLDLHDTINLSALINNSEAWNLNKGETDELEKIEIKAIKLLFDLPTHIPTAALIHHFGLLYTRQRIEQRQLLYLWKIINRDEQHWTKQTLHELMRRDIGWGKTIKNTLSKYCLPLNLQEIKSQRKTEWTRRVKIAIENENTRRLIEECHKIENGVEKRKTKTAHIIDLIKDPEYRRTRANELNECNKSETKTILIARFGMLECGKNFKGSQNIICNGCRVIDDEDHRLNTCLKYRDINFLSCDTKIDFQLIFSNDVEVVKKTASEISRVWNTRNANGSMNDVAEC